MDEFEEFADEMVAELLRARGFYPSSEKEKYELLKEVDSVDSTPVVDQRFLHELEEVLAIRTQRLSNSIVRGHSDRLSKLRAQTDVAFKKASGNFVDPSLSINDLYDSIDGTLRVKRKFAGMSSRRSIDEAYSS
jgi:hypothetical protein